ncbi:MAG: NUDIX hydrolase [Oscillospiraceae bacterium]|jgi:8-oxo-dGTP diphosphatase|nr:NUDIX hydrolase [Oscillospiraceae bacterium]
MNTITLSNGAAAFLKRGGDYLLMKRASNREISPGVWSSPAGKIERDELNDPQAACLREVQEETGITSGQIRNLTLRYIIVRRYRDTIRQTYVYFGETDAEPSVTTDEGELYWIPERELLDRTYTATFTAMLEHYLHTPDSRRVVVGVAENDNGKCRMVWTAAEAWEESAL